MNPRHLSLLSLAVLASCYDGAGTSESPPAITNPAPDEPEAPQQPSGTSLLLEVVDPEGRPIPRAAVSLPLAATDPGLDPDAPTTGVRSKRYLEFRTDPAGRVLLEDLEAVVGDRLVAKVEAREFASASVVLEGVTLGARLGARVVLVPIAAREAFDTRKGVLLEHAGVRVEIPADGVVDEQGLPFDGIAELSVVPFDSTSRLLEQPGPLTALREDKTETQLRSYGMLEASLWSEGRRLQLAQGARARIELPLPSSLRAGPAPLQVGQTIEAWWFDLDRGLWIEEGAGQVALATGRPGELAWVADVGHFTWWNVDAPWWQHSCLLVSVHKDGAPVQGVTVQVVGQWGESKPQVTDANGEACTAMAVGEVGTMYVGPKNAPIIPPFEVMGLPEPAACSGEGGACQPLPIDLTPNDSECDPGDSYKCEYTGPEGTDGVGECEGGKRYCGIDHKWKADCEGEQLPEMEDPNTPQDENCNGDPHDGMIECPQIGDDAFCYTGPAGTFEVGECGGGQKKCIEENGNLVWGPCIGETPPDVEVCDSEEDEDCDGNPGCGEATWQVSGGDAQAQVLTSVAVGANGDVFVLGRASGVMQLGGVMFDAGPVEQTVLAHLLPDGTAVAVVPLGASLGGELEIAVRGDQQVFVTGTLNGVFAAQGQCPQRVSSDASDGLLLEFDGATCERARVLGGANGPTIPSAVAVGGDRVYVAGAFGGTLEQLQTAANKDDAFVLAFAANNINAAPQLQRQFASGWPSVRVDRPALAARSDGFAVVFAFGGIVNLNGEAVPPGALGSTMLARFDADGGVVWAAKLDDYAMLPTSGFGLVLDSTGAPVVAADHGAGLQVSQWREPLAPYWIEEIVDGSLPRPELGGARLALDSEDWVVMNASLLQNGVDQAYMRKWNPDGVADWTHTAGDPVTMTHGLGVATSPVDRSNYVVGRMEGDVTFPGNVMIDIGDMDAADGYVVKLQP